MLCCSSVFWMCVHAVPVVPFKPKGSNILWMCYSFLLLIMFKLYPQTKKCNQSLHKAWESPLPWSSSRNILNSLLVIYWPEFHFSGPEYHTSQNVIDKNWPHKKKTVKCQTIFFFSLFSYDPGHCSSSSDLMKNPWIYWMYIQVAVHVEDRELSLGIHQCKLIEEE